ncbi:lipase family protein [Paractinoplanes deccanensis]|uniref:hypothetical protein n=1 Tax=Paractinoplanes deccanensis TaxID=113561 RepID=UPI001943AD57|nr:hypothetical protein [Actinoplanes deccanensis]
MGLVFVHGIGNRSTSAYSRKVALRDALFRRFLIARAVPELIDVPIRNPMWGDLGARLSWQHASLPAGRPGERLGGGDVWLSDLLTAVGAGPSGQPLSKTAGADPRDAVDLLYSTIDLRGRDDAEIEEVADLAVALVEWCQPGLRSFAGLDDDRELVEVLLREAVPAPVPGAGSEKLGGGRGTGAVRTILLAAVDRFRRQNVGPPVRSAAAALRRLAGRPVSLLIGDVLAYLSGRGSAGAPGDIVSLVSGDLDLAAREGPLVIVAHSMGGNIAYDVLSHFRPDLRVDTLVTVGTQIGLFEELKLFAASDHDLPTPAVPRLPALPNVRRWINIVDRGDVLAYRAAPIFDGVDDFEYPSDAPWAHGAYFRQPNFHDRLARRVEKARS